MLLDGFEFAQRIPKFSRALDRGSFCCFGTKFSSTFTSRSPSRLNLIYYSETVIEIAQELSFTGVKLTGIFESLASEYTLLSFRGP